MVRAPACCTFQARRPDARCSGVRVSRSSSATAARSSPSAVEAAGCGAVIVTDARVDLGPFTAGYDVLRADAAALPTVLDALLNDAVREQALRAAARETVRRSSLALAAAQLLRASDDPPAPPRTPGVGLRADRARDDSGGGAIAEGARTAHDRGSHAASAPGAARAVAGAACERAPAGHDACVGDGATAGLSVLIPLHDYELYVEAACRSALAARDVTLRGRRRRRRLERRWRCPCRSVDGREPDSAIALLRLPTNGGLAGARNRGSAIARAPLVLFLDADDELLPHGPARLRDALDGDPGAAFSYGLLSVETPTGPVGLLNAEPWNPDLLRDGNYVNALALLRAEVYAEIGGYRSDGPLELGWEDYDLWLRVAHAGLRGAHVRQIVGRHRAHDGSRTSTADAIADELMDYLRDRYPALLGVRG